jgi:hypothetical protein
MDMNLRTNLLAKIKAKTSQIGGGAGPTVSLRDFFEGNDDFGSIGCNLNSSPGPQRFYEVFKQLAERPDVQGIFVEIRDLMDDGVSWPFSDTVFILGSIPMDELRRQLEELQPDEVGNFPKEGIPKDLPVPQAGMTILGAWWD